MRLKSIIFFAVTFLASIFLFQNCSGTKFTDEYTLQDTAGNPAVEIKYCEYNGKVDYLPGTIIKTFVTSSVAFNAECAEQSHECNEGKFSGTTGFPTCGKSVPQDCRIGTDVIAHGTRVERWEAATVPYTGTCRSEQRECTNGSIPGSYAVKTPCVKQAPPSRNGKLDCRLREGQNRIIIEDLYEEWTDGTYTFKEKCSDWHSERDNSGYNCGQISQNAYPSLGQINEQPSCCPQGKITVNGKCMPIVGVGASCFADTNCQDGLECGTNTANPASAFGACRTKL